MLSHDSKITDQIRGHVHGAGDPRGGVVFAAVLVSAKQNIEVISHQVLERVIQDDAPNSRPPGAEPKRGGGPAALFHGESLGQQRCVSGFRHQRDLRQPPGHGGTGGHPLRLPPAGPAGGHYRQLRPAVYAPGLRPVPAHRLRGHVHGAGHPAGTDGLLSPDRPGGPDPAAGGLHSAGPVGHPPGGKAWQQQRQFVADASHELKTPLTVLLADADILLAHPEQTIDSQRKWVEYIQDEARRMKELVEDLLFLARNDSAAEKERKRQPVVLSDVCWNCMLSFEPVAFERGAQVNGDIDPEVRLLGDEGQLRRLVTILLDNACKYAGPAGVVTLRLGRSGERVTLTVHNTGEAISAEDQQHLFERFYRTDAARDRQKGGYGLGLSIVKEIIQAHGENIDVVSTEGVGTEFIFSLPRSTNL